MLEGADLACVKGERCLFRDLSFELQEGTLLRVQGPNGSGKTSLLRILCGLSLPAEGTVRWHGVDIQKLREEYCSALVYVGHANAIKDDLTALENLELGARLSGRSVPREAALGALDQLGVAHCAPLPTRVLSQGQRRRVTLARLIVARASPLWILDEPFTALDAAAVSFLAGLIAEHVAARGAAVLTTHQDVTIEAADERRIDLGAC